MITLWDGYCIDADANNYILGIPTTTVRKGEEEESMRDATYHGTLGEALRAFYRKQLRESIKKESHTLSTAFAEAVLGAFELLDQWYWTSAVFHFVWLRRDSSL